MKTVLALVSLYVAYNVAMGVWSYSWKEVDGFANIRLKRDRIIVEGSRWSGGMRHSEPVTIGDFEYIYDAGGVTHNHSSRISYFNSLYDYLFEDGCHTARIKVYVCPLFPSFSVLEKGIRFGYEPVCVFSVGLFICFIAAYYYFEGKIRTERRRRDT